MTASPPSSSRDRSPGAPHVFHALDGLRGIAAIVIAIYHVPFLWPQDIPAGVFYESYLSVDFFFVLSGFVLAYSYGRRLEADLSADQFILMRLIRLYPLYFCAFLISVGVECLALRHGLVSAATAIARVTFAAAFFPAPFGVSLYPMNFPAWSLFYEVVANRAFAMTGKRLTTRVLTIIVAVAALTLLFAVSSRSLGFGTMEGAMNAGSQWPAIGAGFARVAYSFFAGVLVFRLWRAQSRKIVLPPLALFAVLIVILAAPPSGAYQTAFDLLA
ncbi:MAG TPA: acyltransferase, partial [Roseiarcus sp.]|nr:acyltransferase [Roseiarcus sp.]